MGDLAVGSLTMGSVGNLAVRLYDTPVNSLPDDLYIPPEAFAIWLEQFEGPLDFLLYLVKKNNFDLTTIQILPITEQYLTYINELDERHFELAGDYLLMASTLINIKSALLLPTPTVIADSNDPTKSLIERLEQYAQIKQASHHLDKLVRLERDVFMAYASLPDAAALAEHIAPYPASLLAASLIKMQLKPDYQLHHIKADIVPLADRIQAISSLLSKRGRGSFFDILNQSQGKLGVVVSFVAVLELAKQRCIEFDLAPDIEDNSTSSMQNVTLVWVKQ